MGWIEKLLSKFLTFKEISLDNDKTVYLRRFDIVRKEDHQNTYLHHILQSDKGRDLHDHPWDFSTFILWGSYIEHLPNGKSLKRGMFSFRRHNASWIHRLELINDRPVWTLFRVGPKSEKIWGFYTKTGFVPYTEYTYE